MTEGIAICFFASCGKCSESKLCDAKPQRITEASLKRDDNEHKKISEIMKNTMKNMVMTSQWSKFTNLA